MKQFLEMLRRMLGLEKDVDKILKPISRIVDQLEEHGRSQHQAAIDKEIEAQRLREAAAAARINSDKALNLKDNFSSLLGNISNQVAAK